MRHRPFYLSECLSELPPLRETVAGQEYHYPEQTSPRSGCTNKPVSLLCRSLAGKPGHGGRKTVAPSARNVTEMLNYSVVGSEGEFFPLTIRGSGKGIFTTFTQNFSKFFLNG